MTEIPEELPADPWDMHAAWWQDNFTAGADPEYEEQILPTIVRLLAGYGRILDLGCGEGQIARRLVAGSGGTIAVGLDPSEPQLRSARSRGGATGWVRADAARVPLRAAAFDAVVACLVFEHLAELEAPVAEVARVLRPGGVFLLLLNHPLLQTPGSGWIDDHILDEQYWRVGPYLQEATTWEEVAPGITLPFVHRPLSRYVNTLRDHDLVIDALEEPAPPPGFLARAPEYAAAASIPRLLVLRTVKGGHAPA